MQRWHVVRTERRIAISLSAETSGMWYGKGEGMQKQQATGGEDTVVLILER